MKQYLEQRIKELTEKWLRYEEKYQNAKSESLAKSYYHTLEKIDAIIAELETLLEMIGE